MTIALIIVAILIIAVVIILAAASTRPNTFRVQRSALIQATPERLYPLLADFRQWTGWSPWEKMDPAMKRDYGGPAAGRGATYAWQGSGKVGAGRMEIVEVDPPRTLRVKLDFIRPFEAHNMVTFTLEPRDAATLVTWTMEGPVPLVAKVMHMFMDMDKMVGGDFARGLANLKALAEGQGPGGENTQRKPEPLTITRVIDAPRAQVFDAWVDSRQLARWWGPRGFSNPVCSIDARMGGRIRIDMTSPDGDVYPMGGEVLEVVVPERLIFTSTTFVDSTGHPHLEAHNTVNFVAQGATTLLELRAEITRATPDVADAVAGMPEGWGQSLDRLSELVTGRRH